MSNLRAPLAVPWLTGLVLSIAALAGALRWTVAAAPKREPLGAIERHQAGGYVGSAACQSCHPGFYASWHKTFHRSMTRTTSELWDGSTDDAPTFPVDLMLDGRSYHLEKNQLGLEMTGPDLDWVGQRLSSIAQTTDASRAWKQRQEQTVWQNAPIVTRPVPLLTGSHHYLAFWVGSSPERPLRQFPFVFLLDERIFIPRREAFLQPPEAASHVARFNANCIQCHTVGGRPRQTEGRDEVTGQFWEKYETDLADLGIACEACHGPGLAHKTHYQNPLTRFVAAKNRHGAVEEGESQAVPNARSHELFVPTSMHPIESSDVCGQCHSYFLPNEPQIWWESGFARTFSAGDRLDRSRTVLRRRAEQTDREGFDEGFLHLGAAPDQLFYADGSIRVGGREYNGLIESPCFQKGSGSRKLSCVSCHSMHEGAAAGQIKPQFAGSGANGMCAQCHDMAPDHSRHEPTSKGSLCVNCHMPKTSYALLSGITSHRVGNPELPLGEEKSDRPPSPCALCHVDRSRTWLQANLSAFMQKKPNVAVRSGTEIPWALQRALGGNAAIRAVLLAALASDEALSTSGRAAFDLAVEQLAQDDYAAIVHMARRAKKSVDLRAGGLRPAAQVPLDHVRREDLARLHAGRDRTPIVISE